MSCKTIRRLFFGTLFAFASLLLVSLPLITHTLALNLPSEWVEMPKSGIPKLVEPAYVSVAFFFLILICCDFWFFLELVNPTDNQES